MNKETEEKVKIIFPINDEESPIRSERMWARVIDADNIIFEVKNSPFFVTGISYMDQVKAIINEDNEYVFTEVYEKSGHSTYHVLLKEGTVDDIRSVMHLGATCERGNSTLFALDIAPDIDIEPIHKKLIEGVEQGIWDFEETDMNC